ncbi:MAG: contractile injection system protein, VgrG/Pvc8 family [Candidatus Binatus sp.]|uniref:phage late control D family protein n=1 Tax=Candidatus Binatus sp. TaxID=2811406 RepID=UPI002716D004|nr:contractile injection system protein, VgrG/Pvc8 family [Candidatus Binatus sp.]MDO8431780.1 contractile injection system protein, VgrG/Pvc8 family [Candidatus Binatus sp.]
MGSLISLPVRSPRWDLSYRGVSLTAKVSGMVISITYTSEVEKLSPEMEVEFEDRDKRWQGPWFPIRGDLVTLNIGYEHEKLVPCGDFEVDSVELKGPPDTVHMKCLAAGIKPSLRTANTTAYENLTVTEIAGAIAKKHGYTLKAEPETINPKIERMTQKNQTDLEFLRELAEDHNYNFAVRPPQLIFTSKTRLEARPSVATIKRTEVERFRFEAKTHQLYKSAQVTYQDPATKKLISAVFNADRPVPTGDVLKLQQRAENGQQAKQLAIAALHRNNMNETTGSLAMPGNVAMASGNIVDISGFGQFDSRFLITTARHRLERSSGYTTELEVRSVE